MKRIFFISLATLFFFGFSYLHKNSGKLKLPREVARSFAFVPMGKLVLDSTEYSIHAFFISKYEVTNEQYNAFLQDLRYTKETDKLKIASIDSNQWVKEYRYCEPFKVHYHSHPAYNKYPVVNISYDAAVLYCEWLTEKINREYEGDYIFQCRLPQRKEWMRAAIGNESPKPYTWGGPYLVNKKGELLCNYRTIGDANIHYNEETESYEVLQGGKSILGNTHFNASFLFTAPVDSYNENVLGIYNMNGNVAEMLHNSEIVAGGSWSSPGFDVQIKSTARNTAPAPTIGFRPVISFRKKPGYSN